MTADPSHPAASDAPSAATTPQPRLGRWVGLAIVAGVVVSVAIAATSDLDRVGEALNQLGAGWLLLALAAALSAHLVKAARWHWYLRRVTLPADRRVGWLESLAIFWTGVLMLLTPGHVGEFSKSYYAAARDGPDPARTVPIIFAERATNMLGLVVVGAAGVFAFRDAAWIVAISAAIAIFLVATLKSRRLAETVARILERLPLVREVVPHAEEFNQAAGRLLTPTSLVVMTVVAAISWLLEAAAFVAILAGIGLELDASVWNRATFAWTTATLAGGLLLVPGGLGVLEGGAAGLAVTLIAPLNRGAAVAAVLITRLATLWIPGALGAIALGWLSRRPR